MDEAITMKVRSNTAVPSLASAIFRHLKVGTNVELIAIGAGATNQAAKGIARASSFAGAEGYSIATKVGFTSVDIELEDDIITKTGLRFRLELS